MVIDAMNESTGRRFYVHSGTGSDAAGAGVSPDAPCATLDYAIANLAEANRGDVIYCMPGHAETIIADSGVDIDKAGVKVQGLGWGASRPTFTFNTDVAADFKLAAASSWVDNVIFLNDIDNSTGIVEVSAADCKLTNCEWREANAAKFADVLLLTTADADRLEVANFRVIGNAADGAVTLFRFVGADDLHVHHGYMFGDCTAGLIEFHTTASLGVFLHNLDLINDDATGGADAVHGIKDTVSGVTGQVGPYINVFLNANAANISGAVVGTSLFCQRPIMVCNLANEAGMASDRTDSTDA